jgi:lipid-A-disaccharide synthase
VLAAADLAISKSGTVNLELALLDVPQVVLYRVSQLTYSIGRLLKFSISFMSPPNLVVMRQIVPELLQEQATPENLVKEALELLLNPERRQQTLADYQEMRELLGEVGVCDRAAREILQLANGEKQKQKLSSQSFGYSVSQLREVDQNNLTPNPFPTREGE